MYILFVRMRINRFDRTFDTYINHYLKLVAYYKGLLGVDTVESIAGNTSREFLEKEFKNEKSHNQLYVDLMTVTLFLAWIILIGVFIQLNTLVP